MGEEDLKYLLEKLETVGYEVCSDSDQAGLFVWLHRENGRVVDNSEESFSTLEEAARDCAIAAFFCLWYERAGM